jgi:hypothetical protein
MFCLVVHAGSSSGEYGWWEPSATTTQQQQEVPAPAPAHTTTPPSSGPLSPSLAPLLFSSHCPLSTVGAAGLDLVRPPLPAFSAHPRLFGACVSLLNGCQGGGEGEGICLHRGGKIYRPTCCRSCGHKSEREWGCKYVFSFYMLVQHSTSFN